MCKIEKNQDREERIIMEVVVDAYGPQERAAGWYYYLDDKMNIPFEASCIKKIKSSPLNEGEKVTVLEMTDEGDLRGIYVNIQWKDRSFSVPLEQLHPLDEDEETVEAVEDWQYWVDCGYQF
jgi:hypothetical protein